MRQVVRYVCDYCSTEYPYPEHAAACNNRDILIATKVTAAKAEESKWQKIGHAVWHEYGGMKHAPRVDPKKFGAHSYAEEEERTSDCKYLCGCWMGSCSSGGPVNPFGACPKNPKGIDK